MITPCPVGQAIEIFTCPTESVTCPGQSGSPYCHRSGYSHPCSANNLFDAPYSHSRSVYCHHSFTSVQSGREPITVPDLYHVITCHHFKLWTGCKVEVGQTVPSTTGAEFTKRCKATSIQFCTVASHIVNSANEKVVEGQPKYEAGEVYVTYLNKN